MGQPHRSDKAPAKASDPARSRSLFGRRAERAMLDRPVADVRAGQGGALVLRGEPGIGKTELLEHARLSAPDFRVLHATGAQFETELAFAVLHQLCTPLLDRVNELPRPQREALETAFGQRTGSRPDAFLVGLAVLGVMSLAAEERPLMCLVDDAHWLDQASAQALALAARRVGAESVVLLFAERDAEGRGHLAGLPEWQVPPLGDEDARALLTAQIHAPRDARVRDSIVAEAAQGNPLALLELTMSPRLQAAWVLVVLFAWRGVVEDIGGPFVRGVRGAC